MMWGQTGFVPKHLIPSSPLEALVTWHLWCCTILWDYLSFSWCLIILQDPVWALVGIHRLAQSEDTSFVSSVSVFSCRLMMRLIWHLLKKCSFCFGKVSFKSDIVMLLFLLSSELQFACIVVKYKKAKELIIPCFPVSFICTKQQWEEVQ